MRRRVHVKPAMGGWVVLEQTTLGCFFDDLMRSGPFVAVRNLVWPLRHG